MDGQGKVEGLIKAEGRAEFYPTSQCPFYTIPTGDNSVYGDQLYVTLKNIAENKGTFSGKAKWCTDGLSALPEKNEVRDFSGTVFPSSEQYQLATF